MSRESELKLALLEVGSRYVTVRGFGVESGSEVIVRRRKGKVQLIAVYEPIGAQLEAEAVKCA